MANEIRFNPNDPSVRRFLGHLGFNTTVINRGVIDDGDAALSQINFDVLEVIASGEESPLDVPRPDFYELTGSEARKYFQLSYEKRVKISYLLSPFLTSFCYRFAFERRRIARNILEMPNLILAGGHLDKARCSYIDNNRPFDYRDFIGIDYVAEQLLPHHAAPGRAVYKIDITLRNETLNMEVPSGGTGILVSSEGRMISAHHVVFDWEKNDAFASPKIVTPEGETIRLEQSDIVATDRERDYVVFNVPALKGRSFIKISDRSPAKGDRVWIIGFPADFTGKEANQRHYTLGKVLGYDAQTGKITLDAEIVGGYSGAAIVRDGEVIGVAHSSLVNCLGIGLFCVSLETLGTSMVGRVKQEK